MTRFVFASLFLLFGAALSFSQSAGSISGTVTIDDSVLHGAEVHILQLKRSAQTDEVGKYQFTDLPPGRYTVLVHKEGFSDSSRIVDLAAGAAAQADFQLTLASIREQVTITASGTEQSVFDSFQTVNSVGSGRIAERASTSLGEVLETETGVAKRSFGPGSSRPVIRGFDGDRVLVLQDGVRSGSVGSQSGDRRRVRRVDAVGSEAIDDENRHEPPRQLAASQIAAWPYRLVRAAPRPRGEARGRPCTPNQGLPATPSDHA